MKKITTLKDIEIGKGANKFFSDLLDEVYLVGGAVRDEIIGRETTDLDYATPCSSEEVVHKLRSVGLPVRTEAIKYGTVGTRIGVFSVQITTYRKEAYQEGSRHPAIERSRTIDSDLSRRDFTFNAMAASIHEFVDPYGGLNDLRDGVIRTVGDASSRFKEDPIRILRAYRFVSQLGFELTEQAILAAGSHSPLVATLSRGRIGDELAKILGGTYWADAIIEMADAGVITSIFASTDIGGEVSSRIVRRRLEQYTLNQLEKLDVASRWAILAGLVDESKKGSASTREVSEGLVETFGRNLELGGSLIADITERYESLFRAERSPKRHSDRLEYLKSEIDESLVGSDAKNTSIKSAIIFEEARLQFKFKNFNAATEGLRASLKLLDISFENMIKNTRPEIRAAKVSTYKFDYSERIKYLLACVMIQKRILEKEVSLSSIGKTALRGNKGLALRFSEAEWRGLIEEGIVLVYRATEKSYQLGVFDDFLRNVATHLPSDRIYHLRKNNYSDIIHSRDSSAIERRDAYISTLDLMSQKGVSISSKEYIEVELDSCIWGCLATTNIKEFWGEYDKLDRVAEKVLSLNQYDSVRKSYLASASVLMHPLSFEISVDKKYEVSLMLVSHYLMSRTSAGRRNAGRFRIYLDWFKTLKLIDSVKDMRKTLPGVVRQLHTLKSLGYIDDDEVYFTTKMSDLAETRQKLSYAYNFLNYIMGNIKSFELTGEDSLKGISTLLDSNLISYDDAFKVFQKWCSAQSRSNIDSVEYNTLQWDYRDGSAKSENVIAIESGESSSVEFKSSFRYNIHTNELDKTGGIPFTSVRTIAAFLNTVGGKLFIGVTDEGVITGLEQSDFRVLSSDTPVHKKVDAIKLQIDEYLDKHIGSQHVNYTQTSWEQYGDATFICIDVKPSGVPIFCNNQFFVRTSSGCRELKGHEMLQYTTEHFRVSS